MGSGLKRIVSVVLHAFVVPDSQIMNITGLLHLENGNAIDTDDAVQTAAEASK